MQVITNKEIISSFGNFGADEQIEIPDNIAVEWIHAQLVREAPAYPEREKKVVQPTEKKRNRSAKQ